MTATNDSPHEVTYGVGRSSSEDRPLIDYAVKPALLGHPFVDEHGPQVALARDRLAKIVEGSRIAWERYDAAAEAHKEAVGAWWTACEDAIAAGKEPPPKPEPPTIEHASVMRNAREKAKADLAAACLAEGQQVIDAVINLQDAYVDKLLTKRLPINLAEWSKRPLSELGELGPLVDHLRGLLNRDRRRGAEPLDLRRSRPATLAHLFEGRIL